MQLSDIWMLFVALALTMYIVLDGYDLGIGVLTLLDRDPNRRREMHELVAWTWDGNESWLILLALSSQVLGWLLITVSLPRLPAVVTSVLLTLQPVCSVLFAALLLGEDPSAFQLLGVAAILSGLLLASASRRGGDVAPSDGVGGGTAEERKRDQELVAQ